MKLAALLPTFLLAAFAQPQDPQPKPLPAPGSEAATALLLRALATMDALPNGGFVAEHEQDIAMMRGQGLPLGGGSTRVEGGWDQERRWAEIEDDRLVIQGGRMVVETDRGWRLRRTQLDSGQDAPFLLEPRLLFAQLAELPAGDRAVVHVEAATIQQEEAAILTLTLAGETARDLALSGALPTGGMGGLVVMGGVFGGAMPQKSYRVDVALSVAVASGQILRLRAKVYEDDPMLGQIQIQFQGAGDDGARDLDTDEEDEEQADNAPPSFKKGLPVRKPGMTENVTYLRVDFRDLGTAKAPEVDAQGLRWLRGN